MAAVVLTGIKPSGSPHFGNYVGAIRPALRLAETASRALFFIADYHALTAVHEPERLDDFVHEVAAAWMALGLDVDRVVFFRQSAVPEIVELSWILSCVTPKGLMNRAHAYKARVAENLEAGSDPDAGVNLGLYAYPVLMAADILLFGTDVVPVGEDQTQHVEIARELARRFNAAYAPLFKVPVAHTPGHVGAIVGPDGRKMSKRYENTLPLFASPAKLREIIMSYVTDSSKPSEPKDPLSSPLFRLYEELASVEEVRALGSRYRSGISWAEAKEELVRVTERFIAEPRRRYAELMADRALVDSILAGGAEQARAMAIPMLSSVRRAVGLR